MCFFKLDCREHEQVKRGGLFFGDDYFNGYVIQVRTPHFAPPCVLGGLFNLFGPLQLEGVLF